MVASKENSRIFNLQSIEILAKNSNLQLPEFQEGEVLDLANIVYKSAILSKNQALTKITSNNDPSMAQ